MVGKTDFRPWMDHYIQFSSRAETLAMLDLNVAIVNLHDKLGLPHNPMTFSLYGLSPNRGKQISQEIVAEIAEESAIVANDIIRTIVEVNSGKWEQDE